MIYEILGDSAEYEYLTEAVEISKGVQGMCIEIGLRRGMGTKTIIDAVRQFCPHKTVISVDPYGNIPYIGREHNGYVHLDYTDQMRNECMSALWSYIAENPVNYQFFNWTDDEFFKRMHDFVPVYKEKSNIIGDMCYSMVHLDGPHSVDDVKFELDFFIPRMRIGATVVFDDITPDFYDHSEIERYMGDQFEIIRTGNKKQLCKKLTKGRYDA